MSALPNAWPGLMPAPSPAPDRRKFIGGSDIAAILGISPWRTAVDLWLDKTKPPVEGSENHQAKARGKRLEPYIIDMVRAEYGMEITSANQRYIDKAVPFFACEVDCEAAVDDVIDNVELKTVHPFKAKEWGDLETDQLPLHYLAQCQWGLGITGRSVCHVFALIGDDLRRYVVDRDNETIDAMRRRAEHFWLEFVDKHIQPPLDYADSRTLDTLKKLYPGTDGTSIEANPEHEHWRAVLATAAEMVDKYQGVVDGARAHLLAEMGNAALLRFSDGKAFRRKEIRKKAQTIQYPEVRYMDFRLVNVKEEA
jgi:putative phage-type endonuclease